MGITTTAARCLPALFVAACALTPGGAPGDDRTTSSDEALTRVIGTPGPTEPRSLPPPPPPLFCPDVDPLCAVSTITPAWSEEGAAALGCGTAFHYAWDDDHAEPSVIALCPNTPAVTAKWVLVDPQCDACLSRPAAGYVYVVFKHAGHHHPRCQTGCNR